MIAYVHILTPDDDKHPVCGYLTELQARCLNDFARIALRLQPDADRLDLYWSYSAQQTPFYMWRKRPDQTWESRDGDQPDDAWKPAPLNTQAKQL